MKTSSNISDWFAAKDYLKNGQYDVPYTSFIYGQRVDTVKDMLFGGIKAAETGCGAIAIYNAAQLLGRHRNLSDIIYEFDLNPNSKTSNIITMITAATIPAVGMISAINPWNGYFGASPDGISNYLEYHNFKYEATYDFNEFRSWAKKDRVFIVLMLNDKNNIKSGAHYVALQADGDGTYTTYNLYSGDTLDRPGLNLSTDIIKDGAFICGFYIPKG